ncbi:MAG TPA: SprT-like domain-containing protein [Bryobacteraceae bacterium]|jgi:predicted SprT family Zn-dependent metalloprotease|nr:SprT-like domain-containing protein [Bryobacteraceae bacterium]
MKPLPITKIEYGEFQKAYAFLNDELFEGALPNILVTLQRLSRAHGYFSPNRFSNREADISVHEIALNPDGFVNRTDEEIISTLAHEMVHLWQHAYGKPGRRGYHNLQWAKKMKEVGLQPSDTGEENGKETGERVSHYIVGGGPFSKAYKKLEAKGIQLHWQSIPKRGAGKTKFSCSNCGQNAWAKPDAWLLCGACNGARMSGK